MRILLIAILLIASPALWAGCESSIQEGSHTALDKKEARIGAREEARDQCYPGKASKLDRRCEQVTLTISGQAQQGWRCVEEVACKLCGENLRRKYEVME